MRRSVRAVMAGTLEHPGLIPVGRRRTGRAASLMGVAIIGLAATWAEGADLPTNPPTTADLGTVGDRSAGVNIAWVVIGGGLGLLMTLGFTLAETGLARAKNASQTTALVLGTLAASVLGFWASGFATMFGGLGEFPTLGSAGGVLDAMGSIRLGGRTWDLVGLRGYFLVTTDPLPAGLLAAFFLHAVAVNAAATIPTGAMLERWRFGPALLFGAMAGALIVPVFGGWVWGGGWLADLGTTLGLGTGVVDFAGSGVIHLTGGLMALVGTRALGPRIGKFNPDGTANAIPGHNVPLVVVGSLALAGGGLALNLGRTLGVTDTRVAAIAVNSILAAGAGSLAAFGATRWVFRKPDPTMGCNGLLAGLVAISAPCAFVSPGAAVIIGTLAGFLVVGSILALDKSLRIDDPVGAISVHGTCGAFGLLCVGLFANPELHSRLTGDQPVGFFHNGTIDQLAAQVVGVVACVAWVAPTTWATLAAIDRLVGNRVAARAEIEGLDVPEMGVLGYVGEETYAVRTAGQDFLATFGPGVPPKSAPSNRPAPDPTERRRP